MKEYFLESDRIGFSRWKKEDIELANSIWADSNVTEFIGGNMTNSKIIERLSKELSNESKYGIQYWPMHLLKSNKFIGCCGLRPYNLDKKIFEIGFHICSDSWRQGYAFEAGESVIDYAFHNLDASSLFAGHNPNNLGSQKVLTKLGFNYTHTELYEPTGLYHPSYVLSKEIYNRMKKKVNAPHTLFINI